MVQLEELVAVAGDDRVAVAPVEPELPRNAEESRNTRSRCAANVAW